MNSHNKSIAECLVAAGQGDREAFHQIYNKVSPFIFSFLASRTNNSDDAKDLLQELMLDVWQSLPRFKYKSNKQFWSFLYTIARRKLAKYYDQNKQSVYLSDNYPSHDDSVNNIHNKQFINKLIYKLPDKLRAVIELRYFVDLSFIGIAEQLGEKETTVKVRHHRAIKKLIQLAKAYE